MKKSQRGFIVPLIIIIAMLAIVGGVYIYNGNKQSNENSVVEANELYLFKKPNLLYS